MTLTKDVKDRLLPIDCVHFGTFRGKPTAQSDVYRAAGERAGRLYSYFVSGNTEVPVKTRAAKRFQAITGFHPQEVRVIIKQTNSLLKELE